MLPFKKSYDYYLKNAPCLTTKLKRVFYKINFYIIITCIKKYFYDIKAYFGISNFVLCKVVACCIFYSIALDIIYCLRGIPKSVAASGFNFYKAYIFAFTGNYINFSKPSEAVVGADYFIIVFSQKFNCIIFSNFALFNIIDKVSSPRRASQSYFIHLILPLAYHKVPSYAFFSPRASQILLTTHVFSLQLTM